MWRIDRSSMWRSIVHVLLRCVAVLGVTTYRLATVRPTQQSWLSPLTDHGSQHVRGAAQCGALCSVTEACNCYEMSEDRTCRIGRLAPESVGASPERASEHKLHVQEGAVDFVRDLIATGTNFLEAAWYFNHSLYVCYVKDCHRRPLGEEDSEQWTQIGSLSMQRRGYNVVDLGERLFLSGGFSFGGGTEGTAVESTETLFKHKEHWHSNSLRLPEPAAFHGVARISASKIFVMGGLRKRSNGRSKKTWLYDFDNAALGWKERASMPRAQGYMAGVNYYKDVASGKEYVLAIGGTTTSILALPGHGDMYRYDLQHNEWSTIGTLPKMVGRVSNLQINGRIFLDGPDPANRAIWEFHPINNTITKYGSTELLIEVAVAYNID